MKEYNYNAININSINEFKNKKDEEEFIQDEYQTTLRYLKPALLFSGIIILLFAIPDYLFVYADNSVFITTLYLRILFFLLVILLYIKTTKIDSFAKLPLWITGAEIACTIVYYNIILMNEEPNLLLKSFDIILIIIIFNIVPNRWIYNVLSSLVALIALIVYSYRIDYYNFNPGIVYSLLIFVFISLFTYKYEGYRRYNYFIKKQLIDITNTDPLTGIYNRSKLEIEINNKYLDYQENKCPFSLIVFDLDEFKKINDNYGHLYGDEIILELIKVVKISIRSDDIFARWGGDEFFILLPNTKQKDANELGNRIIRNIDKHFKEYPHNISCSFGIIEYISGETIEQFVKRADKLMYLAKKSGKNIFSYE
ncbi:MAG: GGDEF domain-containing protein [Eubacteriaceae bacterium]